MSSLRYNQMVSWGSYNKLAVQVRNSTEITDAQREELMRDLQVRGRQATPEVAKKFKRFKKEGRARNRTG